DAERARRAPGWAADRTGAWPGPGVGCPAATWSDTRPPWVSDRVSARRTRTDSMIVPRLPTAGPPLWTAGLLLSEPLPGEPPGVPPGLVLATFAGAGPAEQLASPASSTAASAEPASLVPDSLVPASRAPVSLVPAGLVSDSRAPANLEPSSPKPASLPPASRAPVSLVPASLAPASRAPVSLVPGSLEPAS